ANGNVQFSTPQLLQLPANTSVHSCVITFNVTVLKVPTKDSNVGILGQQTLQLTFGDFTDAVTQEGPTESGSSDEVTVTGPTLTITKSPKNGMIVSGQLAEFTLVVSNPGSGAANGVTVTDQLPGPPIVWTVTGQPSLGTCTIDALNLMTCTGLGNLAPGDTRTI